jgi:signal transduction histidine kinase
MSFIEGDTISGESIAHIAHVIDNVSAGIWEYNTNSGKAKWSKGVFTILGYAPNEIELSYDLFLDNLLYYGDKEAFLSNINPSSNNATATAIPIRLLTKQQGYQWFESSAQKYDTAGGQVICGVFTNINVYKTNELKTAQNQFQCAELGRIAKIGGWEIDTSSMKLTLSKEVYDIFELNDMVQLSLEEAISFFEPQYRPLLITAIEQAIRNCKPYDMDVLFKTVKGNTIWVRAKAEPVFDDEGKCTLIRGIFQDIDSTKKKDISLQSSINLLDDQNKRLQNFAYIVSHNLRSHAGNLKFMVNVFEESKSEEDRRQLFENIKTISESLSATMGHLDEIVKIQSEISRERKLVNFETIFNNVTLALKANIIAANATINTDFSGCEEIDYIPAYLESIAQNLITNALKYKHPDRDPLISCYTKKANDNIYLIFEDNGIGIDMKRYGHQLFGMYKTFHYNSDSKGIGLFITRNQVEALGGTITAESTVNVGTRFTVKLV